MARTKKTKAPTQDAQATLEQGAEQISQGIESVTAFGQENVDAVVTSSKIAAKAAETIAAEIAAYSKKSYDDSIAAVQDIAECKSVNEVIEKQTAYAQALMNSFVSEANKLGEMYAAAAKDAFAPLTARVAFASDAVTDRRV